MVYTIKQLSRLAGVSTRTLRYYDQIGLLNPTRNPDNGYREYSAATLLQLQQILFFRELDFSLQDIQEIINSPNFDVLNALEVHRKNLLQRVQRLNHLVETVEKTVKHLRGETTMTEGEYYGGFSEEQEKRYTEEARQRYDAKAVDESVNRWKSYSKEQKNKILEEGAANTRALASLMDKDPASEEVQEVVKAWHKHIEYFYLCSYEIAKGLGQLYVDDAAFRANYEAFHPDMPEFFQKAINIYCEGKTGYADFS
ncbi:MAG: MerR family transcriptional regulator [Anaerolineaceae bacterium]|nr:MerR family transcriptional regulator [Anaerolineaceae bacterium]